MKVIRISKSNEVKEIDISGNLESLQSEVGGYIEFIDLGSGLSMVVNEEGKLKRLPVNVIATKIFSSSFGAYDVIAGDVLLVGVDKDGRTIEVPQGAYDFIPQREI